MSPRIANPCATVDMHSNLKISAVCVFLYSEEGKWTENDSVNQN